MSSVSKIIFKLNYKNENYKLKGLIWEFETTTKCHFGYAGDEYPCIMIEFDRKTQRITMFRLRAQKFGGWRNDNRAICMKPKIPVKGALDLLMMTALSFVEKFIGRVSIKIEDAAMVEDNYPLSWLKFWDSSKKGLHRTTYAKYGFVSRKLKDTNLPSEEAEKYFDSYLKFVSRNLKQEIPLNAARELRIGSGVSFEEYLRKIFETRKYEVELNKLNSKIQNFEFNYTVTGNYFMNWNIYDDIEDKVKLEVVKMKQI